MNRDEIRAQLVRPDEKLVVGYVTAGEPRSKFVDSIDRYRTFDTFLGAQRLADPWRIVNRSGANVSRARNEIVAKFIDLDGQPPWLFMVDDDMTFDLTAPEKLLAWARPDRIVGGLCFSFGDDGILPVMFDKDEHGRFLRWTEQIPVNTVQPVAATGAACLMVHREALVRIGEKSRSPYAWFREVEHELTDDSLQWISEDIWFCAKAYEVGVTVCVHTGVEVGHIKSVIIDRALFEAQVPLRMG